MAYGIILLLCGAGGYLVTGAKSALISGGITGILLVTAGMLGDNSKLMKWLGTIVTGMAALMFSWRLTVAFPKIETNPEFATVVMFMAAMAAAGVFSLILVIRSLKNDN